ncbi:MAG: alpha/beta fold hydrolase [Nitrospinae bacterium]|nr:alpha/beta fold hydrolase [Nitrospinota bacterium]
MSAGDAALVFIHGWGANGGIWDEQKKYFADKYRILAPDLPGHGANRGRVKNGAHTLVECGKDVAELIRRENIKTAHVVGWSLGSQVAMHTARFSDAIRSLVMVCGTPCFVGADGCDWGIPEGKARWFRGACASDFKKYHEVFVKSFLDFEKELPDGRRGWIRESLLGNPPETGPAMELLDDFHRADLRPSIGGIGRDLFVIHGARDKITPVGVVNFWKEAHGLRKTEIFAECGHAPFLTAPDKFNAVLGECLAGL